PFDIDPETAATTRQIHPLTARILYRNVEIQRLLEAMHSPATYAMPTSATSLQQSVSGFGYSSTFLPTRTAYKKLMLSS
ncbi:hypothetical protein DFQ30_005442, partial [Apophysomyces sp. BC1015]